MVRSLLMRQSVETRFVESICEDLAGADATAFVEMEFQVAAMSRGIRVHGCFSISERVEEGNEGADLVSKFDFASRM